MVSCKLSDCCSRVPPGFVACKAVYVYNFGSNSFHSFHCAGFTCHYDNYVNHTDAMIAISCSAFCLCCCQCMSLEPRRIQNIGNLASEIRHGRLCGDCAACNVCIICFICFQNALLYNVVVLSLYNESVLKIISTCIEWSIKWKMKQFWQLVNMY